MTISGCGPSRAAGGSSCAMWLHCSFCRRDNHTPWYKNSVLAANSGFATLAALASLSFCFLSELIFMFLLFSDPLLHEACFKVGLLLSVFFYCLLSLLLSSSILSSLSLNRLWVVDGLFMWRAWHKEKEAGNSVPADVAGGHGFFQ